MNASHCIPSFFTVLLVCLAHSLWPSSLFADNAARGPALVRDIYPLAMTHHSWSPKSARVLKRKESVAGVALLWGNTNSLSENYRIDAETRDFRFQYRRGIIENGEVSIEIPVVWRGGGVLDPFIDGWHDFWGLPQGNRNKVPDSEYSVSGLSIDGNFDLEQSGVRLGNIVLGGKYTLLKEKGAWPELAFDAQVSLPTSTDTMGHKGIDALAGFLGSYALQQLHFYFGAAGLYVNDTEIQSIGYERWRLETFATIEYAFEQFSLFAGTTLTSAVVKNIPSHPDYSGYIDFGLAVEVNEEAIIDVVLRENLVSERGGLDVAMLIGVRWKFTGFE